LGIRIYKKAFVIADDFTEPMTQ